MALTGMQKFLYDWRGTPYYLALIFKDNQVIKTLSEPYGAKQFVWETKEKDVPSRMYVVNQDAGFTWSNRTIFIFDVDDASGKEISSSGEDIRIGQKIDPAQIDYFVGSDILGGAFRELKGEPKRSNFNIVQIGLAIGLVIIVLFYFLTGGF